MSMQEMAAVITRFQAATDALAALGARLGMGESDTVAPEILTTLDEVLTAAGLDHRIEIRRQDMLDLDDADRYDCVWVPSFFFGPEVFAKVLPKIIAATRPGGHVVMAHHEPPPDPLPRTTMRLRTIRDGGSVLDADGAADLLRGAGCLDVHSLTRTWPIPFGFVTGQKA
jgi:hypothetical protein